MQSHDDDENIMDDVRCLFDANLSTIVKSFDFNDNVKNIQIEVAEDEDPGHYQSGIFLWPAAIALCHYFIRVQNVQELMKYKSLLELGAGTALVSMCYCKLLIMNQLVHLSHPNSKQQEFQCLITDRDETCLNLIQNSIKINNYTRFGDDWIQTQVLTYNNNNDIKNMQYDLLYGSDLIYSIQIASELLYTVKKLLNVKNKYAKFILCSSFRHQDTTKFIIDLCKQKLGLNYIMIQNEISQNGVIIEEFSLFCSTFEI